jgi:YggT family protein
VSFAVASILVQVVNFYELLIFVYVIMSWFPVRGMLYDVQGVLATIVEPYLGVFRRFIPAFGGMDFSPLAAILVLQFVKVGLAGLA